MWRLISSISQALASAALALAVVAAPAKALPAVYWTDEGLDLVQRGVGDPAEIETLASGVNSAGITAAGGSLYWVDRGSPFVFGDETLVRSDLDGGNPLVLADVFSGLRNPVDIAVDAANGILYWSDIRNLTIQRGTIDPVLGVVTDAEVLFNLVSLRPANYGFGPGQTVEFTEAFALALDDANGVLYWTDRFAGDIHRAGVDGSGITPLISLGEDTLLLGIDLDVPGGKMYWTTGDGHEIQRSDLDGSNPETILSGLSGPHDIAVDSEAGSLYWTDPDDAAVWRSNLDGSGMTSVAVLPAIAAPTGIAIAAAEPSRWALTGASLLALGLLRRFRRASLPAQR